MITNKVFDKTRTTYTYIYTDVAFNEVEIDDIVSYCGKLNVTRGKVYGEESIEENSTVPENLKSVRISNVCFIHPDENTQWIFERLNYHIDGLNQRFYDFDLVGYDFMQYTEYDESYEGKYGRHMDFRPGPIDPTVKMESYLTRKLSFVLMLNDPSEYEGGEFSFYFGESGDSVIEQKKGRLIIFPSFLIHQVSKVTKGNRKSLVGWIEGPKFK